MNADEQRLIVSLEARLTKYERDMARAGRATNDNFKKMEGRAQQSTRNMEKSVSKASASIGEKLEGMFAPLMRGGAVVAAAGGLALAFKEAAASVAEVDREARKAGVTSKVWQQWTYVATAAGVSIDGMTDGLKELNIRGAEFAKTGKGSAADAFKRLGLSADDVNAKLANPSAFLDEIITKLQKMSQADQTLNLDELFGGAGEELAKTLGMSVAEIQKLRGEAETFTTEQIEAAKKVDAEWSTVWRNFTVYAKKAAIEGVGVAGKIIGALRGDFLPGYDEAKGNVARLSSPEAQLKRLQAQRQSIVDQIASVKAEPFNVLKESELRTLEATLKALDEQIHDVTGGSDEFKQALKELSGMTTRLDSGFEKNVTSTANFKSALVELKNLVPELKAELDTLATTDGIDAAYQNAMKNARTMSEVMSATDLANRAKSIAKFGKHDNILDLIASVESGGDYNATLDHGRWTGGAQNLTGMTLNQVRALQHQMLANPANRALYGEGKGSSALGRYQITGATLEGLMKELGLSGDRLYDEATQDELARALLRRRGNNPAELRKEWTGLNRVDDGTIRDKYSSTPTAAQPLAPTTGQQQAIDLAKQQDEARKSLNRTVQEGLDLARFEQSISGMSANQQRVELQLFQAQQEAKRAGIVLSDTELAKMREQLTLTGQLTAKNQEVATSAEGLKNAQQFFADGFTSSLSGLLTGTQTLQGALQGLLNSLIDATLQAALLGKGPLSGLFGGMGGGIFGGLFGFPAAPAVGLYASGGHVRGPGTGTSDSIPARLSDGEYVVNAKATAKNRALLEAINEGRELHLATGGYVGSAPAIRRPNLKGANGNLVQSISINAPVTVNGSAGTPDQNADLAAQMARQMEQVMRGVVASEIQKQSRPGNVLNSRGR